MEMSVPSTSAPVAGPSPAARTALAEILTGRETVAEGVLNTQSALALSERAGVEMPIVNAVHRVLFESVPVAVGLTVPVTR